MKKLSLSAAPLLGLTVLLACSDGIGPVPFQGASGTVHLVGQPPDSTEWVRVVAYRDLPQSTLDLLRVAQVSDSLPLDSAAVGFLMALDTGSYAWLPVVWKKRDAPLSADALRVMGWYTGAEPRGVPGTFRVGRDSQTTNLDVVAEFDNLLTPQEALEAIR